MYNSRSHPLLSQIPLTVSPFISLPTATTLPYTYLPLPSTLPPSFTSSHTKTDPEKYVLSPSGHAASPEEIVASCEALQAHITKVEEDAERTIKEWEEDLRNRELAEKRRVAPGWLDREEKILEPNRGNGGFGPMADSGLVGSANIMDRQEERVPGVERGEQKPDPAGDELDRAFGGMDLQKNAQS
ncbi:hypothetical protein MMC28_005233 [Mycoblastus sanguinarius]|nr:hypothetical protein [Mycoblastus sanguinarius]